MSTAAQKFKKATTAINAVNKFESGKSDMSKLSQRLKAIKHGDNNMYDHLKSVIVSMALNQQPISSFESYSFIQRDPSVAGGDYRVAEDFSKIKQYQTKNRTLIGKINVGTQQDPQQPASLGYVPDFNQESRMFEKFGTGFGQDQTYRIFKSLAKLAHKKSAKQVRLWGKIFGSQKDYYIAEGVADGGQDPGQLTPDTQPKGVGVNKYTFWVTNELASDWSELPIVTPTQIQISRKIKYLFTGDLSRSIMSNPLFPGKQSHLLKCQIARINTTCTIIPKGMLVNNAENPNEVESPEEYTFPETANLAKSADWVYCNVSILKNGRTALIKPEGMEPQDEQKWVKKMSQIDPSEPRLKSIAMDNNQWNVKSFGLDQTYKTIGKVPKVVSKGVVAVKNLLWPGWLTIAYNGKYSSIYIGYGHKFKHNYYPSEPEPVLQQAQDKNEVVIDQ